MAKWLCTHRRQLITLCLLLILLAFGGHFLADATGISLHSVAVTDLHGHFLPTFMTVLIAPRPTALVSVLSTTLFRYWAAPPTPPPPIAVLV